METENFYFDYETRSEVDLKKLGVYEYSIHPTTDIICMAYSYKGKTGLWLPGQHMPKAFKEAQNNKNVKFVAHNSLFEYCITEYVFKRYFSLVDIPIERYKCTAAKAAACALPRSLEGAAMALNLQVKKDTDGRRLMLKYTKPRPSYLKNKTGPKFYNDEFELWSIYDYCQTDIKVTELLDKSLPDLSEYEQKVWIKNQKMNLRGVAVDVDTAKKVLRLSKHHIESLQREVKTITHGALDSVLKVKEVLNWLSSRGVNLSNLQSQTVNEVLDHGGLSYDVESVLKIRQMVSKTSNKKYFAMVERSGESGRVRDLTLYHGASTGREAGRGLQIQNLPRGTIKNTEQAIDIIKSVETIDDLKMFYSNPANVFSSCIRGMITASKGHELFVADFNAIECRVLNWLAGNKETLDDFKNDRDPYKKLASKIFNVHIDEVDDDQRFCGKQGVLACGYGLGPKKFVVLCATYGREISEDLAQKTVKTYRETNKEVVQFWFNVEQAAIKAIKNPKTKYTVNRTTWFVYKGFLWCELPSGRRLAFYKPTLRNEKTPWGEYISKIYYYRTNPKTKKWESCGTYGGSLVESVCQATARDLTVNGIMNVSEMGFDYLFQVHDEIICEGLKGSHRIENFIKAMVEKPKWCQDLPLKASGWIGERYKK